MHNRVAVKRPTAAYHDSHFCFQVLQSVRSLSASESVITMSYSSIILPMRDLTVIWPLSWLFWFMSRSLSVADGGRKILAGWKAGWNLRSDLEGYTLVEKTPTVFIPPFYFQYALEVAARVATLSKTDIWQLKYWGAYRLVNRESSGRNWIVSKDCLDMSSYIRLHDKFTTDVMKYNVWADDGLLGRTFALTN